MAAPASAPTLSVPAVLGINFGNSYASIAVLNKQGLPDCIANENGERQIAAAISFNGTETYVGNDAKPQLVKNAKNTILHFRDLLGKSYSEVANVTNTSSPIIAKEGQPAFSVQVEEPFVPPTAPTSSKATPVTSPPPEPTSFEKILTASDAATMLFKSLLGSATDFLGSSIDAAVITVPSHFNASQRSAVKKAAEDAGIPVLQLLEEAPAATLAYLDPAQDTTSLVLDIGASSTSITVLSVKQGLVHILGSSLLEVGGDAIDNLLISYFLSDFKKKTGVTLSASSTSAADIRALTKLGLAIEETKRSLSASTAAAPCFVESLKDGTDYSGSITPERFDLLLQGIARKIKDGIYDLLESIPLETVDIDQVLLVGSSALLPNLINQVGVVFEANTQIRSDIDTSQALCRGAAIHASVLASLAPEDPLRAAFAEDAAALDVQTTGSPIGLHFPSESGDVWVPVIATDTPLPARRTVSVNVALKTGTEGKHTVGFEVWEAKETINVTVNEIPPPDDDPDAEPDEEHIKDKVVEKETFLSAVQLQVEGTKTGKKKAKAPTHASLAITFVLGLDGVLEVTAQEAGSSTAPTIVKIGA